MYILVDNNTNDILFLDNNLEVVIERRQIFPEKSLDIIEDNYGKYIGMSMRLSDLIFNYSLFKERNFKIIYF